MTITKPALNTGVKEPVSIKKCQNCEFYRQFSWTKIHRDLLDRNAATQTIRDYKMSYGSTFTSGFCDHDDHKSGVPKGDWCKRHQPHGIQRRDPWPKDGEIEYPDNLSVSRYDAGASPMAQKRMSTDGEP